MRSPRPIERVWQALIDVERVAPCLPGAAVTGRNDDGSYNGTFTIKIGPTTAVYTGKLEMRERRRGAAPATMHAQGTDKRGQGGAKATIISTLTATDDGGTRVDVVTDYHITGRLARFGRGGMIEDISERLLREFAERLQESLVADPAAPEPEAAAERRGRRRRGRGAGCGRGPGGGRAPAAAEAEAQPTEPSPTVPPPRRGAPARRGSRSSRPSRSRGCPWPAA